MRRKTVCLLFVIRNVFSLLSPKKISTNRRLYSSRDTNSNDDEDIGSNWMRDSNKIEYIMGSLYGQSVNSLVELGLTPPVRKDSDKDEDISIIPFHLTSASDLFCNRELNMNQIEAVGFDMDWTLAQYKEEFDLLAYNGAMTLLVENFGYPTDLYSYRYKQDLYRRGCIIDKKRGNILKLDRHRYVRVAEHGLTPLTRADRKAIYQYSFEGIYTLITIVTIISWCFLLVACAPCVTSILFISNTYI